MSSEIKGYRTLSTIDKKLINKIKSFGDLLGELVEEVRNHPGVDKRWASIGATDLQTGCMALVRAIAQPSTFA